MEEGTTFVMWVVETISSMAWYEHYSLHVLPLVVAALTDSERIEENRLSIFGIWRKDY